MSIWQLSSYLHSSKITVFLAPEVITRPPWRRILQCSVFKHQLCLIAVDEAHCIPEWFGV